MSPPLTLALALAALSAPLVGHAADGPMRFAPGACVDRCADHALYLPSPPVAHHDRLVVFLPGTLMEPDKHDHVLRIAADAGFRALGLSYDNEQACAGCASASIGGFCSTHAPDDPDCFHLVSQTVIYGPTAAPNPYPHTFADDDAIVPRLLDALDRLEARDLLDGLDDYGWGTYAADVAAGDFCRIIFAGFSQGAGYAMLLASLERVGGGVFLDGPNGVVATSFAPGLIPQTWRSWAHATPGDALFAAWHQRSSLVGRDGVLTDLGLPIGTHGVVDPASSLLPAGLHRITTDQIAPTGESEHGSMAKDGAMPIDATSGTPAGSGAGTPLLMGAYTDLFVGAGAYACP